MNYLQNLFNFEWLQGIHRGYGRNELQQRPFMMSRSGAAGIQRFGAAMWSGDIAGRLGSLAAHAANQMHMSLSGMDYYGADIGGFHRNLDGDLNEMYTRWFAYGMLFDVPGRPHVENLCNCKETAPDRIGDRNGNLANARLRYELIPYLYSLAHRANRFAEPVVPPLVYYYQVDTNVRHLGHEKLIGRDLLAAVSTQFGENQQDVYLPAGGWFDWYSHEKFDSQSGLKTSAPLQRNGLLKLPLYAREGAIIPLQFVDDKTFNAVGKRADGSVRNELIAQVFAGTAPTEFTLYEDDGQTTAYREGVFVLSRFEQRWEGDRLRVPAVDVVADQDELIGVADAASTGVVTPLDLGERARRRPAEALESVPGMIVSQHSGEGKANQYYLRGFNIDHGTDLALSVAGMPVNLPTHGHGQGYADMNFLIPELVSGIQYRKGTYAAESGDFSAAGAIKVNYLNVLGAPIVRVEGGTYGYGRVLAAASPAVGRGHLLVAAEGMGNDGPWERPDVMRRWNGLARYSQGSATSGVSITALAYQARWNSSDQIPRRAVDDGALSRFGFLDRSNGGETHRAGVMAEWQRTTTTGTTRAEAYGFDYGLDLFSNFTYFLDDPDAGDQFEQRDERCLLYTSPSPRD